MSFFATQELPIAFDVMHNVVDRPFVLEYMVTSETGRVPWFIKTILVFRA
ncbi:MAG: hypothetical protein JNM62_01140 [Flavobacteriales bacterium]|nr:hypothetical protein [Flavobacteriales bacterium]